MKPATVLLLLLFTLAMIAVHLISGRLLRRIWAGHAPTWLSVVNIFRFEGVYYLALMAYVAWQHSLFLLAPLIAMAVLHVAGWVLAEQRHGSWVTGGGVAARDRILIGVQAFDLAETVVLVYIAWVLARGMVGHP